METPERILAKFDELIADIAADSSRDKREARRAEREAEREAQRETEEQVKAQDLDQVQDEDQIQDEPETSVQSEMEPKAKGEVKPKSKRKVKLAAVPDAESVLVVTGLTKSFGEKVAVAGIDFAVSAGTIFGIVGPNGAGKTTTLSMITGLLRPDHGTVIVHKQDVWANPDLAKRQIGVLPDRLRLFDRLTGGQFLYYAGVLRGLPDWTVRERMSQLAEALGLEEALGRLVADYSAGMVKKITLAAALIHSPRLLVLDEPFESVDPVSIERILEILARFVEGGGTVVLSSHSMDLIQRLCDSVAIIVGGEVLASGTVDEVRGEGSLKEKFIELAGGVAVVEGLEWLQNFSD